MENYLSVARTRNSELGFNLPTEMQTWLRGAERAVVRNRDRSAKAVLFDIYSVVEQHAIDEVCTIASGPRFAVASLLVSCWWMLRGIETNLLCMGSVRFHT